MSCIKFPGSKNELSKASNKENISNNLTSSQLGGIADQVFGHDNWSHAITNQTVDFVDYVTGKYQAGCASIVRVQLRDGTFHEGMGYCNIEGSSKGSAIQKARLASCRDAFQKALICFGGDIKNKIDRLCSRPTSPVSSELVNSLIQHPKTNILNVISNEPLVEPIAASQTDVMMDMVDLDQLIHKDNKQNLVHDSRKSKVEKSNTDSSLSDIASKVNTVININKETEIDISKPSVSIDTINLKDKDNLNTVNSLTNDTKTEVSKTTVSTAISDEEMRLERKRKQRELQEEFKRKQEIKKKYGDNLSKQPNPRY